MPDLKFHGSTIRVYLHKPEQARLDHAQELLLKIAKVECEQQEKARETADALAELAASMTKAIPPVKEQKG